MAICIVTVKLMPESPSENLETIKKSALSSLEKEGAKNASAEEKPIAFGLKAVILKFSFPEEKGTEMIETILAKISGVSSVTIEDYRRAFG